MLDVKAYIKEYVELGIPVLYKNMEIYPIKVKDFFEYSKDIIVIATEKNRIPDINVIQMSYLEFLYNMCMQSEDWFKRLIGLVKICFHIDIDYTKINSSYNPKELLFKEYNDSIFAFPNGINFGFIICKNKEIKFQLNDNIFNSKEFDEIIKIILFQNNKDYDDTIMDEDFKKCMEEYYAIKNKGLVQPTLEDKIDLLMLKTGFSEEKIRELTIRRFENLISKHLDEQEYKLMKSAELIGTKFKVPIEHYMYKQENKKYFDAFTSKEGFESKMQT